jgi:hypothetical protein
MRQDRSYQVEVRSSGQVQMGSISITRFVQGQRITMFDGQSMEARFG